MAELTRRLDVASAALATLREALLVHTYNERLAEEIYGRLASYSALMSAWIGAMGGKRPAL